MLTSASECARDLRAELDAVAALLGADDLRLLVAHATRLLAQADDRARRRAPLGENDIAGK